MNSGIIKELESKFSREYIIKMDIMLEEMKIEYLSARSTHSEFNSMHEGYAVIKEEFDELWDEIKKREPNHSKLEKEGIQVGAMMLAFLVELIQ